MPRNTALTGRAVAPGVHQIKPGLFRLDARRKDPRRAGRGRVRERLFEGSFSEAKKARAALVAELETMAPPVSEPQTIRSFCQSWLKIKKGTVSPTTARTYADVLGLHVLPKLGNLYTDKIERTDLQEWVNNQIGSASPVSIHSRFRTLRTVLRDARADLGLPDITHRIKFPTEEIGDEEDTNSLSPIELGQFLNAWAGKREESLIWILATTGLRWHHASALRWTDIDWEKKTVRVVRGQVRNIVRPVNKNKRAPGALPLHDIVLAKLRAHQMESINRPNPDGYCWPGNTGKPKVPSSIRKTWIKVLKAAGIKKAFGIHGLRRTWIDMARLAGVDAVTARAFAGHASDEMRERYSTVGMDEKTRSVGRILRLVVP